MDQVVDPCVDAVSDACRGVAVGRYAETKPLGVRHCGPKSLDRVLRGTDVGARRKSPASGHDLDAVRSELELGADGGDDVLRGVRFRAEHIAVAARGGDWRACHDHPGSGYDAVFDGRLDGEYDFVPAAEVAHGCDAGAEGSTDSGYAAHDESLVALGGDVGVGVGLCAAMDVGVHLDEAGHQRAVGDLDHVDFLALANGELVLSRHLRDASVGHHDGRVLNGVVPSAVDQAVGLQH